MAITKATDWKEESEQWIIEGFVCDSLTLISGEPKAGKSALAVHLIRSMVTGRELLNEKKPKQLRKIGWMGFDLKWQRELLERAPDIQNNLYFLDPIHYKNEQEWNKFFEELRMSDIELIVIDHLYGLGAGAELDKQYSAQEALSPILYLVRNIGIPVILLTQASKSANGRAAHSVALEGLARWMIRISGSGSKTRKLELIGNGGATETIKVRLNPNELIHISNISTEKISRTREVDLPSRARKILKSAPPDALRNAKELGKWVSEQGWGLNTVDSGRAAVNQLLSSELLSRMDGNTSITAGPKLVT